MITTKEQNFVSKIWGYERWIVNNDKYCGKLLRIAKGKSTSWHYHKLKDEVLYVQSGKIRMVYGEHEDMKNANYMNLMAGDSFHIPIGTIHRLEALEDTDVFEFSTQHFVEDSYRIEIK